MTGEAEQIVTFRLAPRDRAAIDRLVDAGEFRNRSDFLRYAVKHTLDQYQGGEERFRARADLDLAGVDLPAHEARGGKPRPGARGRRGMNL